MLRTGEQYLESLRDGRVVYIGSERVEDVTRHPAFAQAAETVARLYDTKAAPENRDRFCYQEDGEYYSSYFLRPRDREGLERRTESHRAIAELTCGMFGRSPDHVAGFLTGMSMFPEIFDKPERNYGANVEWYYDFLKKNDLFSTYAVLPPQASRSPEFFQRQNRPVPTLQVVDEDDSGVYISGMKMLATGAVVANEIWIGNLLPIPKDQAAQAITCAVPCNAPGLSLWSRQTFADKAANEFDSPLTWRFDETDAMLICERVHVPWERVFVHNDPELSREIYLRTPAHTFGNHQSNVRYLAKMKLILGLAYRVTQSTGAADIPAVRDQLGWLAAMEAQLSGMIDAQIYNCQHWPNGWIGYNKRYVYAALEFCRNNYSPFIDLLRELSGGGVFQMPAGIDVLDDPMTADKFEKYWETPQMPAIDRMKLFRLVWDMVGSEFAGRHQQYEKFYAGASFVVRSHSYREADWNDFCATVDDLMSSYGVPERG